MQTLQKTNLSILTIALFTATILSAVALKSGQANSMQRVTISAKKMTVEEKIAYDTMGQSVQTVLVLGKRVAEKNLAKQDTPQAIKAKGLV